MRDRSVNRYLIDQAQMRAFRALSTAGMIATPTANISTSDLKGTETNLLPTHASTTGTGFSTIYTFNTVPGILGLGFSQMIKGIRSDGAKGALFILSADFRINLAGVITQVGLTQIGTSLADDGTWAVQLLISGSNILVQAHGNNAVAETVTWTLITTQLTVVP